MNDTPLTIENEKKPSEFWLKLGNECDDIVWHTPVNENTIHVIEYSAYQESQEKLNIAIEFMEAMHTHLCSSTGKDVCSQMWYQDVIDEALTKIRQGK